MTAQPGILISTMLSIVVIAIFALLWGSWWMIVRRGERKKGVLMIVAALVLAGNVAIWVA